MTRLAIVIVFCLSAPGLAMASPDMAAPSPPLEPPAKSDQPLDDNLSVSPAPPVRTLPRAESRYYPYREALDLRAGFAGGTHDLNTSQPLYGLDYMFPSFLSPHWELGAEYSDYFGFMVHGGMRWTFHQRSYFRYSLKAALDRQFRGSDGLAEFVELKRYYARLSAAAEYTFWNPVSLRLEYSFFAGSEMSFQTATAGLSYAW